MAFKGQSTLNNYPSMYPSFSTAVTRRYSISTPSRSFPGFTATTPHGRRRQDTAQHTSSISKLQFRESDIRRHHELKNCLESLESVHTGDTTVVMNRREVGERMEMWSTSEAARLLMVRTSPTCDDSEHCNAFHWNILETQITLVHPHNHLISGLQVL